MTIKVKEICLFDKNKICTNCINHQRDFLEKPIDTVELLNKPIGYKMVSGYNLLHDNDY